MESLFFVRPIALWLVLPLAGVVALLARRGGDSRRQFAPIWLFQEQDDRSAGRVRFAWRDPLAASVLIAGLLWIAALAVPAGRRGNPALPGLVVLDTGVAVVFAPTAGSDVAAPDARELTRALSRVRAGGRAAQFYAAGCVPAGPFDDLVQARTARPAPDGPTVGELLLELAPESAQPIEVFSWSEAPPAAQAWRAHQVTVGAAESGRVAMASLDAEGLLAVAVVGRGGLPLRGGRLRVSAPQDTVTLQLDADGHAEADLSNWLMRAHAADTPLVVVLQPLGSATAELAVTAPAPCRVWLACDEPRWEEAIASWPGFQVRRVERGRLPATADGWEAWRATRGPAAGSELFVAVGAPPPPLPEALPWLWVAPQPSHFAGIAFSGAEPADSSPRPIRFDVDGAQDAGALWGGLDLAACPAAAHWQGPLPGWTPAAGDRVLVGPHGAVLNLVAPLSLLGTSEPALAALRLARRMVPSSASIVGPGLPSPAWRWPAARTAAARDDSAPAQADLTARAARTLILLAALASLIALVLARVSWTVRLLAALPMVALAVTALRTPTRQVVLVLDASQSCRSSLPEATARALVGPGGVDRRQAPWIAALDGEGGRWLSTPAARERPPRGEVELAAWLRERLDALPRTPHSRLGSALRSLQSAAPLGSAQSVFVSDGRFEDTPAALADALPVGPLTVVEVGSGRAHDAGIVSLDVVGEGADQAALIVADDGGQTVTVVLEIDGAPAGRQVLEPQPLVGPVDTLQSPFGRLHRVRMPLPTRAVGPHRVTARLLTPRAGTGSGTEEDDALTLVRDDSAPTVEWIHSGTAGQQLPRGGPDLGSRSAPGGSEPPDVWVLDAVPESVVADLEPRLLASLDRGSGLVVLAGPRSWLATGRSGERALEGRLPVRLRVPDERDPAPPPWMVLIDASGSMATVEAGVSHFERALVALSAALTSAKPEEAIGVLAFAERVVAAVPPHTQLTREQVQSALHGVHPSGGTQLLPALQQAADALRALAKPRERDASPRLIVLSDGLTGSEDFAAWEAAAAGCRVIVLEIGTQGTQALRDLATATGGHHRLLRSLDDLAAALGEEAVAPPRDRVVAIPDSVRVEDPVWAPLAPSRVDVHVALARAGGHAPWTLGRLRDPLLALGESGAARVAVLATTPGPPWAGGTRWEGAMAAVLAWAGRRDEPEATWSAAGTPRLQVDPRATPWAAGAPDGAGRLQLVDSAGDTTALEAVVPGVYRPLGARPPGGGIVIDSATGRRVAHLPAQDAAAEVRARGVDRARLAQLRTLASARPNSAADGAVELPRALPIALAAMIWIAVGGMLAVLAVRVPVELGPGGVGAR